LIPSGIGCGRETGGKSLVDGSFERFREIITSSIGMMCFVVTDDNHHESYESYTVHRKRVLYTMSVSK